MYMGTIGVLSAARKPANIFAITGSRFHGKIRDKRIITPITYQIGEYINEIALALIDTGSTESVICLPDARHVTGAEPCDTGMIRWLSGQSENVLYYESVLTFPGGLKLSTDLIDVYEGKSDLADIIIGMDIISKGTLTIDGKNGTFTFEV